MKRRGQKKKEGNERKERSKGGGREESRKGRQEVKGAVKYLHLFFFSPES